MIIKRDRISVPRDATSHANTCKAQFAVALAQRLEEEGLTHVAYAKKAMATISYISQILAGDKNLTIDTMAKLAWAARGRLHINIEPREEEK